MERGVVHLRLLGLRVRLLLLLLLLLLLVLTMVRLPPRFLLLLLGRHCHLPLCGEDSSQFIGYRGNRGKQCTARMADARAGGDGCAGCADSDGLNHGGTEAWRR